jgi:hypothetical protein
MQGRRSVPIAIAVVTLLVSGCSSVGGSPSNDPISHPSGDGLVLRVETKGGLIPLQNVFTNVPSFTLLGDGRVFAPGAVDMIYPGPALLPLLERRLAETGIQAVLHAVASIGLFTASRDFNGAQNVVMDAPTTIFSLRADGREVRISVYGLGNIDMAHPPAGIGAAEVAAHRSLSSLAGKLTNLDPWIPAATWTDPGWTPFQPEALRLMVRNADADPPDQSGIANGLVAWPIATPASTFGQPSPQAASRCGVVTGSDAAAWLAALTRANQLTRFVSEGHRFQVVPRPLLPDEPHACAS